MTSKEVGEAWFPTTLNGTFFKTVKVTVAEGIPVNANDYACIAARNGPNIFMEKVLTIDGSTMSSVLSAFDATAAFLQKGEFYSVTLDDSKMGISGASEGLATVLAFMGLKLQNSMAFTGFVQHIGDPDSHDVLDLSVEAVDSVAIKAKGCAAKGIMLFAGLKNKTDFLGEEFKMKHGNVPGIQEVMLEGKVICYLCASMRDVISQIEAIAKKT